MKKKEEKRPAPKKVKKEIEEVFHPDHFQNVKGVLYPRPYCMQSTANGNALTPDVDGYPDSV